MSKIQAIAELDSGLVISTQATHRTLAKKSNTPKRNGSQAMKSSQVSKNQCMRRVSETTLKPSGPYRLVLLASASFATVPRG